MVCLKRRFYYILFLLIAVLIVVIFNNNFFSHKENVKLIEIPDRTFHRKYIKNIIYNKVIIIGDSRMEYINNRGKKINIPTNFNFIALGGTKTNWFENVALKKLEEKLDRMNENYKYHVVINMGVNDLNDNVEAIKHADDYYLLFKKIVSRYSNVNFYILSVNPINDKIINRFFRPQYRSTSKIQSFNDETINLIDESYFKNLFYCDSYNNIDFGIPDGLHYDKATDQRIVDYIVNDCVKY